MAIVVIVVSLLVQVIAHEAGHAVAIRSYGMKVIRAGLGFGLPEMSVRWRGVQWTVSPWLIGAYVQQSPQESEKVSTGPFGRLALIMNAGVLVNLTTAVGCTFAGALWQGMWWTTAGSVIVLLVIVQFYRQIATYVIPALGPALLAFVLWNVIADMFHGKVTGFTGLGSLVPDDITMLWVLRINALFGFGLAILNAAPLGVTDAGQVWRRILHDRLGGKVSDVTTVASVAVLLVMLGYSVVRDLVNIIS